jgi:hypothetical protein
VEKTRQSFAKPYGEGRTMRERKGSSVAWKGAAALLSTSLYIGGREGWRRPRVSPRGGGGHQRVRPRVWVAPQAPCLPIKGAAALGGRTTSLGDHGLG